MYLSSCGVGLLSFETGTKLKWFVNTGKCLVCVVQLLCMPEAPGSSLMLYTVYQGYLGARLCEESSRKRELI